MPSFISDWQSTRSNELRTSGETFPRVLSVAMPRKGKLRGQSHEVGFLTLPGQPECQGQFVNPPLYLEAIQVQPMARRATSLLEIEVLQECFGSERAVDIAHRLENRHDDTVEERIVDLGEPNVVCPDVLFAVPTYVLNGKVISLGNPDEDWLIAHLYPPGDRRREMD